VIASLFADLVLAAHAAYVLFVVAGGLLVLRWPGSVCPLTPLEVSFRRAAGEAGYSEGFLEHYVEPVLYPSGLTREIQVGLGIAVVVINVAVYTWIWRRRKKRRKER